MNLVVVLVILFSHWVADFVMQTDEQAKNKSSSNMWLLKHVISYFLWMLIVAGNLFRGFELTLPNNQFIEWLLMNTILHFVVDYITSRVSKKLYEKGDVHNFFVVIGFDQFLHVSCLLVTFQYLIGWSQ